MGKGFVVGSRGESCKDIIGSVVGYHKVLYWCLEGSCGGVSDVVGYVMGRMVLIRYCRSFVG